VAGGERRGVRTGFVEVSGGGGEFGSGGMANTADIVVLDSTSTENAAVSKVLSSQVSNGKTRQNNLKTNWGKKNEQANSKKREEDEGGGNG